MHVLEIPEVEQMQVVDMLWQWWLEWNWVSEGDQRRGPSAPAFVVTKQSEEFLTIGEDRQPVIQPAEKDTVSQRATHTG